jgi:serine/threonine-protein kinase
MATGERAPLPSTGDVIEDRYLLQEPLGEGGVGLVFRAQQLRVQREVAVKVLQNEALGEHAMRPRFEQEALTLATLAHPNIVRLQDYGLVAGRPYLVMDLVEGRTLQALMAAEGPLAPTRALSLMQQLAYALAYAHERGVVHRDLKPANLIINDLPHQPEQLTVLDFGFAKFLPLSPASAWRLARRATFPPSSAREGPSMAAPTSTPQASCCSRCSPATRRMRVTRPTCCVTT